MKTFWRDHVITQEEEILVAKLSSAHREATFRQNLSSEVIKAAYAGNGHDFTKAAAAALCTLGGLHAPIVQAYEEISHEDKFNMLSLRIATGDIIPGWGNSFVRGIPDPIVDVVLFYIEAGWPSIAKRINYTTDILHNAKKMVFPNMACVTAATGVILGMPKELIPSLVIQGRAMAWAEIIYESQRQATTEIRDHGK